jgi:para-nitrobenzyl esterase
MACAARARARPFAESPRRQPNHSLRNSPDTFQSLRGNTALLDSASAIPSRPVWTVEHRPPTTRLGSVRMRRVRRMAVADGPIVSVAEGKLQGTYDGPAVVFRGVPYAAPPIGPLRFKPPVAAPAWDGVRPCVEFGSASPQRGAGVPGKYGVPESTSEDCLYLNIWTSAADDGLRPVMLFLHGGANMIGSSGTHVYNGTRTAMRGAVVVTANYRLGPFGFLHLDGLLPGYVGSGNAGILDGIKALEWVKQNIAAFGGDPDRITLMGSSAGGFNLATAITMPAAAGLARRAVPMSAIGGVHRTIEAATLSTLQTLDALGIDRADPARVLDVPTQRLLEAATFPMLQPIAVVDGVTLPTTVYEAIAAGVTDDIEILVGGTTEERRGEMFADMAAEHPQMRPGDYSDLTTKLSWTGLSDAQLREIYAASVTAEGREPTAENIWAAVVSDRTIYGGVAVAIARANAAKPTFVYRSAFHSPQHDGLFGAYHGVPTPFIFDNPELPTWTATLGDPPPLELSRLYNKALIAFAETGSPTIDELPEWLPYDLEHRWTMQWDLETTLVSDPEPARRALYDNAPPSSWRNR